MSAVIELLLADGRTPTGSHAHSGALEPAVRSDLRLDSLPALMAARLRTVGLVDAAFAVAATRATSVHSLEVLEAEWLARTPSPAARATARALGRGLLRAVRGLGLRDEVLEDWSESSQARPRAIVLGVISRLAGIPAARAATLSLYDDLMMLAGAAPKLLAVDALQTAGWIAERAPLIDTLAAQAASDWPASQLPAACTPGLDELAETHARTRERLFAS